MRARLNFSPRQVRAGRALIGWSTDDLAERAGLEPEAIELFEADEGGLGEEERSALALALYRDGDGVITVSADRAGEGVRFAKAR